ncbi:alpha-ribazole phosphatase [soil metagenome]
MQQPGYCYGGGSEVPLAETFEQEAEALRKQLPAEIAHYHTSPMQRCRRLAEHLIPEAVWQVDSRLSEIHFGDWEGRPWEQLEGALLDAWMADFVTIAPPGGESTLQLEERAKSFLGDIAAEDAGGTHLAIAHGGLIRTMVASAIGLPLDHLYQIDVPCGCVVELSRRHDRWQLEKLMAP